jgi:hypothetical protein
LRRFHYVSKWLREKIWGIWVRRCSEQYQKAYYASFPSDLWPAEEEETEHGLYLRLKDGTRLLATGSLADTPREATNAAQEVIQHHFLAISFPFAIPLVEHPKILPLRFDSQWTPPKSLLDRVTS